MSKDAVDLIQLTYNVLEPLLREADEAVALAVQDRTNPMIAFRPEKLKLYQWRADLIANARTNLAVALQLLQKENE